MSESDIVIDHRETVTINGNELRIGFYVTTAEQFDNPRPDAPYTCRQTYWTEDGYGDRRCAQSNTAAVALAIGGLWAKNTPLSDHLTPAPVVTCGSAAEAT